MDCDCRWNRLASGQGPAIDAHAAGTLWGLFQLRLRLSPESIAYRACDPTGRWRDHTWQTVAERVERFRAALGREPLQPGDRIGILVANGIDWICLDLAAHAAGLVVVGLYPQESAATNAYILGHADVRLLLVDTDARWQELDEHRTVFPLLERAWVQESGGPIGRDTRVSRLSDVLRLGVAPPGTTPSAPEDLAVLIYTSGTTGRPKGVMLSHAALLLNAAAVSTIVPVRQDDVFLSILPLAHAFERTVGYYLPMMGGATVAFARSAQMLREDLAAVRPTALLAVPRLFERIAEGIDANVAGSVVKRGLLALAVATGWRRFEALQRGRTLGLWGQLFWSALQHTVAKPVTAAFGGRLRIAVSGGAPLDRGVARQMIGLGVPVVEGYGLTEAGPVVAANYLENNVPGTVGPPLPGVEVRFSLDGELLVRSPALFKGYWKDASATARALGRDGWLATGDMARIEDGRIRLLGRGQDMIVLSIGEKINPTDIEAEILHDPLFAQVAVLGSGRPFLIALAVLNDAAWQAFAGENGLATDHPNAIASAERILARVVTRLSRFPKFAQIRGIHLARTPWTIEAGLSTPTLKVKRDALQRLFTKEIDALYAARR